MPRPKGVAVEIDWQLLSHDLLYMEVDTTEHAPSEILLCMDHPKIKILPHLFLELAVQEVYLPRSECVAFEIDWQLLSPVTTQVHKSAG